MDRSATGRGLPLQSLQRRVRSHGVGKARKALLAAAPHDSAQSQAAEHAHHLLNEVQQSLAACARFVSDDDRGVVAHLEQMRSRIPCSLEQVEEILLEWNTLSRKHGISAWTLPACHETLIQEREGNVKAATLLPEAKEAEAQALVAFEDACREMSSKRQEVASLLSQRVTDRLPLLGMENSKFLVSLDPEARECTDPTAWTRGTDSVDFMLESESGCGPVHEVASSGEKARLLLALECALPGSVGVTCRSGTGSAMSPVAVLYDEIDAHVGGRAAVSVANMLAIQSTSSQVLSITHSPSVAAVADLHVVVTPTSIGSAVDDARRKELARMASGDLATSEAEAFADALIRDGAKYREINRQ